MRDTKTEETGWKCNLGEIAEKRTRGGEYRCETTIFSRIKYRFHSVVNLSDCSIIAEIYAPDSPVTMYMNEGGVYQREKKSRLPGGLSPAKIKSF